ncbi:MAG: hypothetical protein H6718_17960 [Polyangiaceae bacterium]|nr:hypothetical protein [Myxococcales bacterium]MCB9587290.1 hypothetical protein [Polyangiaceae bacterium]MCB9605913.1 hypothetical protein [Polyangiaceae bacterium]
MKSFGTRSRYHASLLTLAIVSALAPAAHAQELVITGELGLGSGLEGGSVDGQTEWQRARTRLTAGSTFHVDEFPEEAWGARAFVEFEPRVGVGAEGRYLRWLSDSFGAYAGVTAAFAPETLFGGGIGLEFNIPLAEKTRLYIEPSFTALPLGTDLPSGSVLMWALVSIGVSLDL